MVVRQLALDERPRDDADHLAARPQGGVGHGAHHADARAAVDQRDALGGEHAAELLRRAAGEGRLTVDELDERLHQAFAARTRAELETLLADVVPSGADALRPVGAPAARLPVRPGEGGARWLIAVMSGCDRRGRWRLAEHATSINFWGGSDLDLNDAELSAQRTTLRVIAIMGGADIRVPDGLRVEVSEFAFMGGNDIKLASGPVDVDGPVLHLKLFSLMGGIDVRRGRRLSRAERRARREQRRLDRR
jgi:hypothetical protein